MIEKKAKCNLNKSNYTSLPVRSLIGALSRPDIAGPVNILSQFMHRPTISVFKYGLQILKFLKSTAKLSLVLEKHNDQILTMYTDANHSLTKKLQSGILILLYGSPILWISKKQSIFAKSSFDAGWCVRVWKKGERKRVFKTKLVNNSFFINLEIKKIKLNKLKKLILCRSNL